MSASTVLYAQDELCTDGILLFREDFGGNDTSDPAVGHTPVSGMTSGYQQVYTLQTSDPGTGMGAGRYLVAKRGYRNSSNSNYSVWHIMDDHTHFGDTTRGYLLEIDGLGSGNDVFYSTVINGLCAGSRLTFSAYVANLTTAGQYNGWRNRNYVHPKLSFVITHPVTGAELALYNTDTISHDWSNYPKSWRETADWQLVGMNFTVPEGIDSVRLSIRNNASGSSTGNDFALDDIEIRLCLTPDTILTDTTVCDTTQHIRWRERLYQIADTLRDTIRNSCGLDSVYYLLNVQTEHCDPPEPTLCTSGILLFREDFGGNNPSDPRVSTTPVQGMSYTLSTSGMGSGRYMVTKSGYCNGDTTGWTLPGADLSGKRSQWYIQDDHTYSNDYSRGYFMEIDGNGGNQQFYETEISGLCEGIELTFSAYVANVFTWFQYDWYTRNRGPVISPCLKFVLTNPQTGATLAEKNTKEIPFDENLPAKTDWQYSSQWHLVGMNFTVPVGVNAIRLSIYNNVTNGNGNDFAIDDIEVHLCMTPDTILTDTTVCDTTRQIRWREKTFAIADTLRDTLFSTCGFDSIYYVMHVEKENCEHALCTDGILLFREDFGGNNPSDPKISTTPVSGMSYTQATTDVLGSMGAGKYLVTKQGYCNGNGTSQWHLQDDHTHFGDLTRGYFMEIDGRAGSDAFYRTTIDHLCEGIELTFSAYVANVMTWGMYVGRPGMYAYPRLKFVLTDPTSNTELATYDTGDIPFDSTFIGDNMCWQQSVEWHLVGMNFTVPVGVESVQLSIYNNVSNSNGNDFAIDDIEVHLCMTPDTIRTDTTVCDTIDQIAWRGKEYAIVDTLRDTLRSSCGFDSIYYLMRVETEHCESPCPEIHYATRDTTVCDTLMPFTWHGLLFNKPGSQTILLKDEQGCDSIEIDYTLSTFHCEDFCLEGKLLFREDFGGNAPNDPDVSCINNPSILYRNGCNTTGRLPEGYYRLTKKDQGYYNHQWVDREDHSYPNDASRGYFLMIEGANNHLFYSTFLSGGAEGDVLSFSAYVINLHDNIHDGEYQLPKILIQLINSDTQEVLANCIPSEMPIATHSEMSNWHIVGTNFTLPTDLSAIEVNMYAYMHGHEGNDFGIDDIELRLCQIPQATRVDTIICDTIDAITWRNKIYPLKNELRDTVYDSSGADSIYYILNVIMEHCCPEIKEKTITIGTLCDTLLPYTLYFRDTVLTFKMAGDLLLEFQHPQWDCIDSIYTLHLDTIHCERLYPIIVNKYNWQLLLDNVTLRRLFPDRTARAFQWFKNEQPIPGATDDDYSEQNELHGRFQLRIELDGNQTIWSNILEINVQRPTTNDQLQVHIFNCHGLPVREDQLTRGIYLYRYQQGDTVWTEKRLIP
ncbi:MAG: hypothetical protein IKG86_05220 [Paludibacteraceae bacterium]|nr:hypothetical protein [Paludibacteraceae bacterium]